ncbi:MAG: hypothetical protein ACRBM6_01480 [Geminicoccales bacterium]
MSASKLFICSHSAGTAVFDRIVQFFKLPPLWADIHSVGNSNLAKSTILMPIVGYMIVFNENLVEYFYLSEIFVWQDDKQLSYRLFLFYFGLSFIGMASLSFQYFCPKTIKLHPTIIEHVEKERSVISRYRINYLIEKIVNEYKMISKYDIWISPYLEASIDTIIANNDDESQDSSRTAKLSDEELTNEILKTYWFVQNRKGKNSRLLTSILYALGFFLLAIPTIDTFLRISTSFFARISS